MSLAELKAFRMYIEVCVCVRPVLDLNHRCFNSALYIAKPTTAKTVAPKLARSQNVELLRSACVTCKAVFRKTQIFLKFSILSVLPMSRERLPL